MKKNVRIPKLNDEDLAEEVGIHIGDGSLNVYGNGFLYSLRGDKVKDEKYYTDFLPKLYKKVFNIDVNIRRWPDVIGFQVGSEAIGSFKQGIGLPLGWKTEIAIPPFILKSRKLTKRCVRGLFDTDGCISFEKKDRDVYYYPRILFSTTSKKLNNQLVRVLKKEFGFNLSCWKWTYKNKKWNDIYRICIRGSANLDKWFDLIGSSNPTSRYKYEHWKKYGYAPVAQR